MSIEYFDKKIEFISRTNLEAFQLTKLKESVAFACESLFYKKTLKNCGASIQSLNDLQSLPFTTEEDIHSHYPYGFMTSIKKDVVRMHSSGSVIQHPALTFYTRSDIDAWSNIIARSLFTMGARNTDVLQNICRYELLPGGLGIQEGSEKIGVITIPAGTGSTRRQLQMMIDLGTTIVHSFPSYIHQLIDTLRELGIDPASQLDLHTIILSGEPNTDAKRREMERILGVKAFHAYGHHMLNGPGIAVECDEQQGMHLWEDHFIIEIIDPKTMMPVQEGETGELVLTTLQRTAMPLIRYRTNDLTRIIPSVCKCGRTHRRIDFISGRTDNKYIIKGCAITEQMIENILKQIPETGDNFRISIENIEGSDELCIDVEVKEMAFLDNYGKLERLNKTIVKEIYEETFVSPILHFVEANSIKHLAGQSRISDLRK